MPKTKKKSCAKRRQDDRARKAKDTSTNSDHGDVHVSMKYSIVAVLVLLFSLINKKYPKNKAYISIYNLMFNQP